MIWLEKRTNVLYRKDEPIVTLSPLERTLIIYFLENPYAHLTKSKIIENCWSPDAVRDGVSDDSLFRLIRSLRQKLSQDSDDDSCYIVNWRGNPEGGYRFLPNGKEQRTKEVALQMPSAETLQQLVALKQIISNQMKTILLLEGILDEVMERFVDEGEIEQQNGRFQLETAVQNSHLILE